MDYEMLDRVATPEEHAELARSVGWESHFDDRLRADALAASVAGVVCVEASGRVIGAARAVGDGLQYAYVQDVMVHPACNDDGIATAMVERLLASIHRWTLGWWRRPDRRGVTCRGQG